MAINREKTLARVRQKEQEKVLSSGRNAVDVYERSGTYTSPSSSSVPSSATAAMDVSPKPITLNSDVEEYRKRTFENYQTQQRKTAERDTAIRNKYSTLDNNTMKEISLVSQGQEADKMTTGLTGFVVGFGSMTGKSDAYSDARMRVDSGNRAYDRLKNEGYSDAEIKKWAEMYSQQESEKFNQALQEDTEALATEHPVLASAGTVALNMASAPLAAASIIDDTARGKIDTNSLALAPTQASRHIRSTVSDNIAEDSEVGAWLYNVGMSGADSLAASAIPGGVALLATNAAVDTTIDLTNRGLDADKALVGGLVAGAAEVIFESISIGKFKKLQEVSPMGVKDVVTNIAKSMGVNFSEEMLTEATNILYDTFANGDLSNYNLMVENYVAQDMPKTKAKSEAAKQLVLQVFEAGAAGAVMGGAFGVIGSVGGYAKNTSQAKALGKAIQQSGSADAVIAEASAAPKKTRPNLASEWAQKKLDKGKDADRALGVTAMETSQYIAQNDAVPVGEFQLATSLEEVEEMYADKKRMYEKASMTKAERSRALSQLDKDYRATVKSFTEYEKSGVSAMREAQADSILESAFKASKSNVSSPEEVAKAVSPTVGTTKDGKVVSVAEIEDISDGEVTVKTTEGESQVLDIEELKGDAKTLWEYASSHFADAKVADAFIKSYSGQNVETYSRVYKAVFDLAATGMSANQIRKEGLFDLSELGESAFESAVKSGAEAMSFRVGVVDLTTRPKTMSQKTVMAVAEEFAKRHSLNVTFVDTLGTKEGFYKKGSNQIVVALDSSKGAIGRTLGHEVYHYITEMSPEHASEIESFVVDTMTRLKGKKWVEGRYKFYEKQGYKTREAQIEEFVADQLFDAFSNENAVREFVKEDVSLAEQILNHIHDIIEEIKGIFKKLVGTGHYSDISAWQGDLDALDELNKTVLRVLADIESSKNGATQKAESIQETVEESVEEIVEESVADEVSDEVVEEVATEEVADEDNAEEIAEEEFDEDAEEDSFGGFEDENTPKYYEMTQEEKDEWDAAVFGLTVEEVRTIRSEAQRERALESEREWSRIWSTEEMDEDDLAFSSKRGYEGFVAKEMGEDSKITTNSNGDITLVSNEDSSVFAYSEVTWNNGGRADLEKALKRNGYSADEVADTIESVDKVLGFLKNLSEDISDNKGYKKLAQHLAADITMDVVNGRQVLHSIVNNGDYPVNIDLALICKKRVAYMQVMKDLIDNGIMEQVKYDGVAIAKINEILRKNGFETACLGCFVESRRLQFQAWAETIVQEWNNAVDVALDGAKAESFNYARLTKDSSSLTAKEMDALERELANAPKNAQGNLNLGKGGVATKMGVLLKAVPTLRKHITVSDLLTPEGLLNLRKDNPNLFSLVKSRYGAASPKIVQDYNPYSGEVADLTFAKVADITHNSVKGGDAYIKAAQKALAKDKPRQPKKMKAAEYKSTEAYIEWYDKVQTLAMRNYLYDIGGARMQSFSDFMIENVFDYVQIVADLAANKFPMHTYTKEISMMRLFGMTGMRINGSLIAHIDKSMGKKYAGLMPVSEAEKGNAVIVKTEDGEFAIGFDDYSRYASTKGTKNESFIQSIGFKDIVALMLDKRYSPYVGNIAIGVSDVQIKAMLDSPLFRMVIPYHASGMLPQFAELVGVDMYNDYTDYQNTGVLQCYDLQGNPVERFKKNSGSEEVDENGETKSKNLPIDTSYPFNAELKRVTERLRASGKSVVDAPRIVASEYIEWCGKMHPVYDGKKFIGYATFSPKFSNSPYGTDFTEHPNYYKLLEDFDLYDSVTEDYVEQGAVEMRFPSADNRMSAEEVAEYRERLKTSGVFTDAEIKSYIKKANMTFEELVTAEVNNRADYDNTQAPKYKATLDEISRELTSTSARTERLKSYSEFTSLLTSQSAKDKTKLKGMLPLEGTYDVPSKLEYSTKRDADYMTAVENGDMETAQRMVDEVAKENGYTVKGYHGTGADFTIFDESKVGGRNVWGRGFYFGSSKGIADDYAQWRERKGGKSRIVSAYLKFKNPFIPSKSSLGTAEEILDKWFPDMWRNSRQLGVGYIQGKLDGSVVDLLQFIAEHNKTEIRDVLSGYGYDGIIDGGEIVAFKSNQIKSADPVTYDDNGDVIPLSERFNPSKSDIRYSTKRESSISEEASDYILNTKEYQKIIDIIKKRYNMLSTESLTPKAIERFANRILKKAQSSYDVGLLTERLTALFDYMSNAGGDIAWEDVMSITADIANDVLQESRRLDRSMSAKYKQTLDYLDSVQLYVDKALKTQIEDEYGSVDNYRRLLGNKVHITTKDKPNSRTKVKRDMVSFGDVWNHLSKDNPEVFDGESSGVERLSSLVSFVEMTKPQYINPYGMIAEESAYDFALTIYDEFFNNSNIRSETMKYNVEDEKLRDEYNEMIDSIRRGYLSRLNEVKRASKTKVEETVSLFRQKHEAYRKKRNETQAKQSLRKSIYRVSKALVDKLVKPTDTKYIPQELTRPLLEFSKIITDGGTFDYKKTNRLIEAFAKMERSNTIDGIDSVIDESILNELMALRDLLEDRTLVELSESELRRVRDIVNDFRHLVSTTNKMHAENIRETVSEMGDTFIAEMADKKVDHKRFGTSFQRGLIKPAVFFDLLESSTMQRLYQNIRNGESEWYRTSAGVKTKIASLQEDYGYSEWKNKPVTIKRKMNGQTLAFTMEEALSIYATSQREQGLQHLLADGFVRQEDEYKRIKKALKKDAKDAKKKGKKSSEETPKAIIEAMQGRAVRLTVEDISAIVDAVKKASDGRAIKYADGFVEYMSKDMAELGNETALKLKGRKIFGEDYYFPIVSDPNHLHFSAAKGIDARLKNMSMTQATVEKAKNAVVIGGFTDTAAKHCLDMAMYTSFTLPLEDFTRVFNYDVDATETSDATGVRQEIERVYGSGANDYIKQLLSDINGGVVVRGSGIVNKLMSMAKRDAVIGSMSVAIQQPSAIARALVYVSPKYFVKTTFSKKDWEQLKEYAPVAGIKEMGYFDMNIGQSALEWVTDKSTVDTFNFGDKLKNARDWTVDKLAWLPSYMDKITWGHIWNAVKKETAELHPKMDINSEEFLKLAGERFTYVIDRTQVYDSVFARSEYMRSKDSGLKQMLAFMNEPLTSLNMFYEAVVMKQDKKKSFVAKTVFSLLSATVLNSALKSIIQTMRDDDDETSAWEQYLANLVENVLYEPFGWIPIFGDVLDYLRTGFESQSMTDSTLRSIADSLMIWFDDNKSTYEKVKATLSSVGLATGLPIKNLWREFEAAKNGIKSFIIGVDNTWGAEWGKSLSEQEWLFGDSGVFFSEDDRKAFAEGGANTTARGVLFALHNALEFEKIKFTEDITVADQAVIAYLKGDQPHQDRAYNTLLRKYDGDAKEVKSVIRTAVKNKYLSGDITKDEVEDILVNLVGDDEEDILWKIEKWDGGEDWTKYGDFYEAIDSGKNLKSVIKEYNDKGVDNSTLAGRITDQYKEQYIELYKTDRQAASKLKTKLVEAYAALGNKREKKSKEIDAWLKPKKDK